MAKKKRKKNPAAAPSAQKITTSSHPIFSKLGKRVMLIGGIFALLGFAVLTQTDPAGQNWESFASPALILLGYATVGFGIVLKDPIPEK